MKCNLNLRLLINNYILPECNIKYAKYFILKKSQNVLNTSILCIKL